MNYTTYNTHSCIKYWCKMSGVSMSVCNNAIVSASLHPLHDLDTRIRSALSHINNKRISI